LEMLTTNPSERAEAYRKFVLQEDDRELVRLFSRERWPVFLGSEKFIAGVKGRFFGKKVDSEVPERKALAPDMDRLIEAVARGYRVRREDLFYSRRGYGKEARNVARYLVRRLRGDRLKEIGEMFGIGRYSTVSSVVQRMKVGMARDEGLRKKVHNLISTISKSQEQT
jgi:hypothetical protein